MAAGAPIVAGAAAEAAGAGATSAAGGSATAGTASATPATASPTTTLNPGADVSATPANTPKPKPQNEGDEESEKKSGKAKQEETKNDKNREGLDKPASGKTSWAQNYEDIEHMAAEAGQAVGKLTGTNTINETVMDGASKVAGLPAAGINKLKDMACDGIEKALTKGSDSKSTPSTNANIDGLTPNKPGQGVGGSDPSPNLDQGPRMGRP